MDPFIPGAWPYLLRALTWAKTHGLYVILDLHGAPGSQNGYDNSGQRTTEPQWALSEENVGRTIDVIRYLAAHLSGMVDILELLNEPTGFRGDAWEQAIRRLWEEGYDAVRAAGSAGMKVMIGDGFFGVDVSTVVFSVVLTVPLKCGASCSDGKGS